MVVWKFVLSFEHCLLFLDADWQEVQDMMVNRPQIPPPDRSRSRPNTLGGFWIFFTKAYYSLWNPFVSFLKIQSVRNNFSLDPPRSPKNFFFVSDQSCIYCNFVSIYSPEEQWSGKLSWQNQTVLERFHNWNMLPLLPAQSVDSSGAYGHQVTSLLKSFFLRKQNQKIMSLCREEATFVLNR